jgi:hypothetical protein
LDGSEVRHRLDIMCYNRNDGRNGIVAASP